jgi:tetratricopeptide (TPR) repeat protein
MTCAEMVERAVSPRAVVIPFGVPADGRGLGLGLAALVHSFAQLDGQSVALAQLFGRRQDEPAGAAPSPVEAFVGPLAWRDLAGQGNAPPDVTVVLTGSFEPPSEGRGSIQILAFDARDGSTRSKAEAPIDGERAGETILRAFEQVWTGVGGDLGIVRDIGDLGWEALESVLRAERCALHDPSRGGPHDRLAAMMHLGRAVGEAPEAKFPAGRLASLALETALSSTADAKLTDAAIRALARAADDAPGQIDLLEATAALHVRLGRTVEAEAVTLVALEQAPTRARLYALLSEARRARGDRIGAMQAVEMGARHAGDDLLLTTERGLVLAEAGDPVGAEMAWRRVLASEPLHVASYANLAAMLLKRGDAGAAQALVDGALASVRAAHPEVLRRAMQLALAMEPEGVARASRVATLARALLERAPDDAWGSMMLARTLVQMGDKRGAAEQLARVESTAPNTAFAAEAQRGLFSLKEPLAALELDAVLRAAYAASPGELEPIAARARRLLAAHPVWPAWFALGVAERRRERWPAAREAFEAAIGLAGGCSPAHRELVGVCIALGEADLALTHAERARLLEGDSPRTLGALASALFAKGSREDATDAIDRALTLDARDEENRVLADRIRGRVSMAPGGGPIRRIYDALDRWRKR